MFQNIPCADAPHGNWDCVLCTHCCRKTSGEPVECFFLERSIQPPRHYLRGKKVCQPGNFVNSTMYHLAKGLYRLATSKEGK